MGPPLVSGPSTEALAGLVDSWHRLDSDQTAEVTDLLLSMCPAACSIAPRENNRYLYLHHGYVVRMYVCTYVPPQLLRSIIIKHCIYANYRMYAYAVCIHTWVNITVCKHEYVCM